MQSNKLILSNRSSRHSQAVINIDLNRINPYKDNKSRIKRANSYMPRKKSTSDKPELSALQKSELCQAFGLFDPRGLGTIPSRGVLLALRAMSYEPTNKQLEDLFRRVLKEKETLDVDFKNFYQLMEAQMLEDMTVKDEERAYKLFSDSTVGGITFEVLKSIADELGEDMSAEEIKEMINVADYDKNGVVGLEEFKKILRNKDFH